MSVLANPECSQLLFIDPVKSHVEQLDRCVERNIPERFNRLSSAADIIQIPRFFAISGTSSLKESWLSAPCEKASPSKIFRFPFNQTPWSNTDLSTAIKRENRDRLFICGFWLESSVCATALDAYVDGFDVHLVIDISPAKSKHDGKTAWERLLQIGVAPISTNQLIYEWMARTPKNEVRKKLHDLIGDDRWL